MEKEFDPTDEKRSAFDWIVWLLIHVALIGGIAAVATYVYGGGLAIWVGLSAFIAGVVSMYLFAKLVPGETIMKVVLYTVAAANAGYLAYNGAREVGVEAFNNAQVQKYEAGIAAAAQASSRRIAATLGASAKDASQLEKVFGDGVSTVAGVLAFLELAVALIVFAVSSKRIAKIQREARPAQTQQTTSSSSGGIGFASAQAPATAKSGGNTTFNGPPPTNFTKPSQ